MTRRINDGDMLSSLIYKAHNPLLFQYRRTILYYISPSKYLSTTGSFGGSIGRTVVA
jgi:hypothetical protein